MGNIGSCPSCNKANSEKFQEEVYNEKVNALKKTYEYMYGTLNEQEELLANVKVTKDDILQRLPSCSCL